jgi:tRNA C32,U32 (ribose-2'-O)-methylase TrmJ
MKESDVHLSEKSMDILSKLLCYVFGPEDGSLSGKHLEHCHRFVVIPTRHCVNLSAAVYLILYDRMIKENPNITIYDVINENRATFDGRNTFASDDNFHKDLGVF